MNDIAGIREGIRKIAGQDPVFGTVCTVSNIDEGEMTCDCTPVNGDADFLGVRLMAQAGNGFVIIPKDESIVVVNQINKATGYVAMVSEIDKVIIILDSGHKLEADSTGFVFNDGTLDGMVKINDLVAKLNNLENLLNDLIIKFNAHSHSTTCGVGVGNAAPILPVQSETGSISPITVKADLENPDIKQ